MYNTFMLSTFLQVIRSVAYIFCAFITLLAYNSLSLSLRLSLPEIARRLVELCGSKLVAITDGSRGSVLATKDNVSIILEYRGHL